MSRFRSGRSAAITLAERPRPTAPWIVLFAGDRLTERGFVSRRAHSPSAREDGAIRGHSPVLVLGTRNVKKRGELAALFEPLGLELKTLGDFSQAIEVVEDGTTFGENARLKAVQQARHLGKWVLGEDSGLVVDALKGAPGVYSARYAGPQASDEDNNRRLIEKLGQTPLESRTAHYVCHMALADATGAVRAESEAYCHGRIRFEPAGSGGFGYDPFFEIIEYHRTFGELGPAVKGVLSHRGRAARLLLPAVETLVRSGAWT